MTNKRSLGNTLEDYVVGKLNSVGIKARRSKTSGARGKEEDVINNKFLIECKLRNTKDITIKESVWLKLLSSIPYNHRKIPLYVLENINKRRFAVLDLEDFIRLVDKEQ